MDVILETDRFLLRKYVEEDAEAFFELKSDPRVLRFVPDAQLVDVEQARQILIDHPIADYQKHGLVVAPAFSKGQASRLAVPG